jgi:nucleoside triphosphate diphosphatase
MSPSSQIEDLLSIMAHLRSEKGCAWDRAQDFTSLTSHTISEAYEVAEAALRGDSEDLCDELGDLLLQVVFYSQIAAEREFFTFSDVIKSLQNKLIRRHPHVFSEQNTLSPDAVSQQWEDIKQQEKVQKAKDRQTSRLDVIPASLNPLMRAQALGMEAAKSGFDWPDSAQVFAKITEELEEVRSALESGEATTIREEIGDLLFAVVNLARHTGTDAQMALATTNQKFCTRFSAIETALAARGRSLEEASLSEMEALWQAAKNPLTSAPESSESR